MSVPLVGDWSVFPDNQIVFVETGSVIPETTSKILPVVCEAFQWTEYDFDEAESAGAFTLTVIVAIVSSKPSVRTYETESDPT